jgi:hypothetical protein
VDSLLNRVFIREQLVSKDPWATSHGVIPGRSFLGTSLLYFTFAYLLPAKTAVIIGSGSGFVPRLIRQAQREIGDEFVKISRCILIDANLNDKGFGSPDYHDDPNHFFRFSYPDIEIWKMTSDEALSKIKEEAISIDFLHIDGDHTFAQSTKDFDQYLAQMSKDFIITLHDTVINEAFEYDGCVPRTIGDLRKAMEPGGKYAHLEMINFNNRLRKESHYFKKEMECHGTAIIKPKVLSLWETELAEDLKMFLYGDTSSQNRS